MNKKRYLITFQAVSGEYLFNDGYLMTQLEIAADMEPQFALGLCRKYNNLDCWEDCTCEFEVWDQKTRRWVNARERGFSITEVIE